MSNGNRIADAPNFERPILSCMNETKDQHQESQKRHANHSQCRHQHSQGDDNHLGQMVQSENQQQQVQQKYHRDSGYGSSPDSEIKPNEFEPLVH